MKTSEVSSASVRKRIPGGWLSRFFENPVVGRDLAAALTGPVLGLVLAIVAAVCLATHLGCYTFFWAFSSIDRIDAGALLVAWLGIVSYCLLLFFLPLRVSGLIEGSRHGKAFDQIVVTGMSPLRVSLGQWALGLVYATLILLTTLPFQIFAYRFEGVTIAEISEGYALLFCYANVIIATTLGLGVTRREWAAVPFVMILGVIAGGISASPFLPTTVRELTPVGHFVGILFESTPVISGGMPRGILAMLGSSPSLFSLYVPLVLFRPLLWLALIFPSGVLILLGPAQRLRPGLDIFGAAVLPGDVKRRFRRGRGGLIRRVEMAFYYENRPRWCAGWDFPLRALIGVLVVGLLWMCAFAFVEQLPRYIRRFGEDENYHILLGFCAFVLFVWTMVTAPVRPRGERTERVGPLHLPRTLLQFGLFVLLLGGLVGISWLDFSQVSAVVSGSSPAGFGFRNGLDFTVYQEQWATYTRQCAFLFLTLFVYGAALGVVMRVAAGWRLLFFILVGVVMIAPIVLTELVREGILPRPWSVLRYASPFTPFVWRDQASDHDSRFMVTIGVALAVGLAAWGGLSSLAAIFDRRREARSEAEARRESSTGGASAVLIVLLSVGGVLAVEASSVALGLGSTAYAQTIAAPGESTDPDARLPLEILRVSHGFGGRRFSDEVDFAAIHVRNPTDETFTVDVDGGYRFDFDPVEIGPATSVALRLEARRSAGEYYPDELVLRSGLRTALVKLPPLVSVPNVSSDGGVDGRFLVIGGANARATAWQKSVSGTPVELVVCEKEELTSSPWAYTGVTAVLLTPGDYSRLRREVRYGLYDFVRLGGSVVFCGGQDLKSLTALEPWGRWLEGATTQRRAGLQVASLENGTSSLYVEEEGGGGAVPLVSVRRVGAGAVALLAVDPVAPKIPKVLVESNVFWRELTLALPRSSYPTFVAATGGSEELTDPAPITAIVLYFLGYVIVLGPVMIVLFRGRRRRRWVWPFVGGAIALFCFGIAFLDFIIHRQPSFAKNCELLILDPSGRSGVATSHLTVRSSGRQRHRFDVGRDLVSVFAPSRRAQPYQGPPPDRWFVEPWREDAASVDWQIAPFGLEALFLVRDVNLSAPISATAQFDRAKKRVTYQVRGDLNARGERFFVFVAGIDPDGRVHIQRSGLRGRGRRAAEEISGKIAVDNPPQGLRWGRSSRWVSQRVDDWLEMRISIGGDGAGAGRPRVFIAWIADVPLDVGSVSSQDLRFRREIGELPETRRGRPPEFQVVDDGGTLYRSYVQQIIVCEATVEFR